MYVVDTVQLAIHNMDLPGKKERNFKFSQQLVRMDLQLQFFFLSFLVRLLGFVDLVLLKSNFPSTNLIGTDIRLVKLVK